MNRKMQDTFLFDDDKAYTEAKRRIKECGEKRAKKLDLSTLSLKEIPPEIAQLQFLEELEISMDYTFQGPYTKLSNMPKNIGNLKKLNTLKIDHAYIKKIPDSLGSCPLQHFELSGSFS